MVNHMPCKEPAVKAGMSELPEPSQREKDAIQLACDKLATKPRPVTLNVEITANGQPAINAPHADGRGFLVRLAETFGSGSTDFALAQLNVLTNATHANVTPEGRASAINAMLAAVAGVQPRDEVEGMLAVQMAATHSLATRLLEQAGQAQHVSTLEATGNMAVKLMRAYTAQVEALAKLRRGGNQTVRVEHVHVHSGGRAIVGHVTHPGGGAKRNAEQPHAPEADADEN